MKTIQFGFEFVKKSPNLLFIFFMIPAGENTCNLGASFLPISLLSGPNSVLEIDQFVFVGRCLFEVVFTLLPGLSLRVLQH